MPGERRRRASRPTRNDGLGHSDVDRVRERLARAAPGEPG